MDTPERAAVKKLAENLSAANQVIEQNKIDIALYRAQAKEQNRRVDVMVSTERLHNKQRDELAAEIGEAHGEAEKARAELKSIYHALDEDWSISSKDIARIVRRVHGNQAGYKS